MQSKAQIDQLLRQKTDAKAAAERMIGRREIYMSGAA